MHVQNIITTILRGLTASGTTADRNKARELLAHLETYKPAPDSKVVRFAAPQPRTRKKATK